MATATAHHYATVNPYTGEVVREFDSLDATAVDRAVDAAHHAFGAWRDRPIEERAAIVRRAGELLAEHSDRLAALVTLEMGKRIVEAREEAHLSAQILDYYGHHGPALAAPRPLENRVGDAVLLTEPLGLLLTVQPWNFPLYQVVRIAGPNLVLGNTILLKHASSCPQSALALEDLFRDAGVPAGVFTNLFIETGDIPGVIESPRVQGVSVTGSEGAGAPVAEQAGRSLKKSVLELGGSDPFIVLDAEYLERTVDAAVKGRLENMGQSCVASKRFIVLHEHYDAFVSGMRDRFAALTPGDPADPATTLAPLSSERAANALMDQVEDAVAKGARGRLRRPTPRPSGGVRGGGSVFAADRDRAQRLAARLETGMVWINRPAASRPELPFGGIKRSGYGRELGAVGIEEFANHKLICAVAPDGPVGGFAG